MDPRKRARLLRLRAEALANAQALQEPRPSLGERTLNAAGGLAGGINEGILGTLDLLSQPVTLPLQALGADVEPNPFSWVGRELGGVPQPEDRTTATRLGNPIGGALIPGLALERAAATTLPHLAAPAVRALQQVPSAFRSAETAAAAGAGVGSEIGSRVGGPMGEAVGGLVGAVTPAGVGAGTRGLVRGGEQGRQAFETATQEMRGIGIQPTAGQAGSNPAAWLEAGVSRFPIAAGMRERQGREVSEAAQREAQRIARGPAGTIRPEASDTALGGRVVEGITGPNGYVERWDKRVDNLYGELRQQLGDNPDIPIDSTLSRLEQLATPTPGAERISARMSNSKISQYYEDLAEDAAENGGVIPYESVRKLRSQIGRIIGAPALHPGEPVAELQSVYGALSDDMRQAAEAAGPDALRAFERANRTFRDGVSFIKKRLQPLVNKAEKRGRPEEIIAEFERSAKKGSSLVQDLKRSLSPSGFDELRSNIVNNLGTATTGVQNAEGTRFSVNTFLNNWNKLAPEAKNALFGGQRTPWSNWRRDLDRLARVMERTKEAAKVGENPSGTAQGLYGSAIAASPGAALGFAATGDLNVLAPALVSLAGGVGGAAVTQKLLQSPKFVNWLAGTTKAPVTQWPARVAQLGKVAAEENDEELQEALLDFQAQAEALTEQLAARPQRPAAAPSVSPYAAPAAPMPPSLPMQQAPGPQSRAPSMWDDLRSPTIAGGLLG